MAIGNIVTAGYGPSASVAFIVTRGYSVGAAVAGTETIYTLNGGATARRNDNVLQEQLGQRANSGALASHSRPKTGRSLGTGRRLGQP